MILQKQNSSDQTDDVNQSIHTLFCIVDSKDEICWEILTPSSLIMVLHFGFWIPDIKYWHRLSPYGSLKKNKVMHFRKKQRHKDFVSF